MVMVSPGVYTTAAEYATALEHWDPGDQNPNHTKGPRAASGPMPQFRPDLEPKKAVTPAPTVAPTTTPAPTGPKPKTPYELAIEAARKNATGAFNAGFKTTGLSSDTFGLNTEFQRLLNLAIQNVPKTATTANINNFINYDDLWNKAKTNVTQGQTGSLTQAYNQLKPAGGQWYADTADDALLKEILGTQYNDTNTSLQNMLNAGQITQPQYDAAIASLGYDPTGANYTGSSATAYNTLQGLGGGVLSNYNTELDTILNNFNTAIGGYSLGSNVSADPYQTQITAAQTGNTGSMRGDILAALGNTKLYDVNTLIQNSNVPSSNSPLPTGTPQGTGGVGIPSTSIPNSGQQGGLGTGQPQQLSGQQVALNEEDDKRGVGTTGTF